MIENMFENLTKWRNLPNYPSKIGIYKQQKKQDMNLPERFETVW